MKTLREMNAAYSVTSRAVLAGVALACSMALPAAAQNAASAADPGAAHWALLQQNCESCHNSTDWAGGVAFDTLTPDDIADDAETWEMAVRKLRGHLMPPPGEKQPAAKDVTSFVTWLEGRLDAAAAAAPAPGEVGVHRLNRTEYARSIKAMLGLDVDVATLLPKDVSMDGFDNIAAVLRTSPAFLEQYIGAARNVSRQAIGRVDAKSSSHEFRVPTYLNQNAHIDGLPLGTRGGFTVDFWFAADGEYEFNIRDFLWMGAGYVTKVDSRHDVILTIDDQRVFQASAGGPEDLKAVDQRQAEAADEMQSRFDHIRVKVKAGQRRVGVAFIQRSMAESDSILRPIAALPEMERVPRIPGLEISGPFNVTGLGDTESRRRIFICKPATPADEAPCARTILSHIAQQAFRRPVTDEDLKAPLSFYAVGREQNGFEGGIEAGLTAILSSTKFLFRTEQLRPGSLVQARADAKVSIAPLDDLAIASRLSFFLWSEGPDQQLIAAAQAGKLRDPAALHAEVSRMLKDPRSRSLVTNFAFQWLNISRMDNIEPQQELYPDFDTNLRTGLREEVRLFLDSVLRSDRSVLDLLASDRTFLNERVALHYGIKDIRGAQFREVKLADANRFGLLGKAALMLSTSYGNRTSPVLRGAFILDNIMGTPPSPPPPGVETDLPTEVGKVPATVRARLEQHRAAPSCNACHGVIDPLGFALENYDVTGAWRTRDLDANAAIDSGGGLGDAKASSPAELSRALLARPDQFVQALTERLMTFALGRSLVYRDMPAIRAIVRSAAPLRYTFESLIQGVVESPAFRMKEVLVDTPATQTASNSPESPR
jgi:mono/diheme cytochrome c family protein